MCLKINYICETYRSKVAYLKVNSKMQLAEERTWLNVNHKLFLVCQKGSLS